MQPARKPPTLADLEALPPGIKGEIIDGVMYTTTRPRGPHQHTGLEIAADLEGGRWIELGVFGDERDARIEPFDAIELDIAGWWM